MSQAVARTAPAFAPAPQNRGQRRHPINRDELSNLPTRKGRPGAKAFFAEIGVHGITDTRIRTASEDASLRKFRIAGHNWYADRDLWDWLQSLASGGRGGAA
ncbi:hypothetical protein BJF87_07685 [Gordonia sp. CNJ-863]|uniref:hypothetical protein n=1 Tax=Gordonia sp. CNJ-863 TaxID=1904963 RepID=UPI0009603B30|nr:hypothetical protein [Gordonia sp. CNJ-863]OLT44467.1 hypothetical protein BJF87_07685 [Gordonia sp. CNJ-863]